MSFVRRVCLILYSGLLAVSGAMVSEGAIVNVMVTVENLAPTNSVSFAPLRVGFSNGAFDAFNINTTATAPIVSIAEGGSGSDWFPAFQAAEPNAILGTVGGALFPGATASQTFTVDSNVNQFFTFASMVIPSNDLFIGNDSPTQFRILDSAGNLLVQQINQNASQIWDANSELAIAANAAFIQGGINANRVAENGLVAFDFSELSVFNGLTTGAGYVFSNSALTANTNIARITFTVTAVPEPSSIALVGISGLAIVFRRFRKKSTSAKT